MRIEVMEEKFTLCRILAMVMVLILCTTMLPLVGSASTDATNWSEAAAETLTGEGTAEAPYQITNGAELAKFLSGTTGYGKLMNDIDLSAYAWFTVTTKFAGTLDGNGYKISGLRLGTAESRVTAANAGLISFLNVGATVKDLTVDVTMYISGNGATAVGGIAGKSTGTINNCTVTGTIDVTHTTNIYVGGIAGQMNANAKILNSVNRASITVGINSTKQIRTGGITGYAVAGSKIENSVNFGNINVTAGALDNATNNCAAGIVVGREAVIVNNSYSFCTIGAKDEAVKTTLVPFTNSNAVVTNGYYWDAENSKYVTYGATDTTYADNAALLEVLNANVTAVTAESGWYSWVLDGNGYPVPGEHFGICADDDKDHTCDLGCDKTFGVHEDTNNDHICEYGCTVKIGECTDADKNHICDYGCAEVIGECADTDKDHACDYGCGKEYGECADADKDHTCDYGCAKVYGECADADKDHACDYGCGKEYGECADADKDHTCDYGCGKEYGECADADKDHACDYGCDKIYGNCEDTDSDGLCDYGCGETFEVEEAPADDLPLFTRIINIIVDFIMNLINKVIALVGLEG